MSYWIDMLEGRVRYIDVDGVSTHVLEAGDENSDWTILMLHGASGHTENFVSQVVPMSKFGHVVAPDMLGHGLSSRPANKQYTIRGMIDHVESLVDVLGAPNVAVIGLSLGGIICAHLAKERPDQVKKLGFVCSGGITPNGPEDNKLPQLAVGSAKGYENPTIEQVRDRFSHMMHGSGVVPEDMMYSRLFMLKYPPARDTVVSVLADYDAHRDIYDVSADILKAIPADTVYFWGRHDSTPVEIVEQAAAIQPHAEVQVFETSGHWPHVDEQELFDQRLSAFLAR